MELGAFLILIPAQGVWQLLDGKLVIYMGLQLTLDSKLHPRRFLVGHKDFQGLKGRISG